MWARACSFLAKIGVACISAWMELVYCCLRNFVIWFPDWRFAIRCGLCSKHCSPSVTSSAHFIFYSWQENGLRTDSCQRFITHLNPFICNLRGNPFTLFKSGVFQRIEISCCCCAFFFFHMKNFRFSSETWDQWRMSIGHVLMFLLGKMCTHSKCLPF